MIMIINSLFNFINVSVIVSFLTKLLALGVLFSTPIREPVVANLVILGTSPLTSFLLALRVVLLPTLVMSGILSSIFFNLALYESFLATSVFIIPLSLLKSTGKGANLLTANLSTLLFKLLTWLGRFLNLSISNLSTSN